jgi:Cof subfamily protein (haloacid dehalogenase superfamily)
VSRPRLVATDLDGTIVRSDDTISARAVDALRAVTDAGSEVVFVTGRPPRWMPRIAAATGHRGLAICANGALVYDMAAERVVETRLLEAELLADLMRALGDALPGLRFAVESETDLLHEPHYPLLWDGDAPGVRRAEQLSDLSQASAAKLLVRHSDADADTLLARTREVVGNLAELTHSSLTALGVTKATTLAALCAERGLTAEDVLAFGDMPNDLAMLSWAGTAYAMGNAHADVLAAVELHTASVEDDGVAQVLEGLFGAS